MTALGLSFDCSIPMDTLWISLLTSSSSKIGFKIKSLSIGKTVSKSLETKFDDIMEDSRVENYLDRNCPYAEEDLMEALEYVSMKFNPVE